MDAKHAVKLSLSDDEQTIRIEGDTDALKRDRRVLMSLKRLDSSFDKSSLTLNVKGRDVSSLLLSLHEALSQRGYVDENNDAADSVVGVFYADEKAFEDFSDQAKHIRNNDCDPADFKHFSDSLVKYLPGRQLYQLQLLSAYHMAFSQNSANFSVPGAGKTTIVYGAYAYLNHLPDSDKKFVGSLVVVGPLSSFQPWEDEFESCFLRKPSVVRLDGSMTLAEKKAYLLSGACADITLVSYGSLSPLRSYLSDFLSHHRSMLVLDEAHKIKNTAGGQWASAALSLASSAVARVVLTGTPAPNGYEDLYNLFEFIWPKRHVTRFRVNQLSAMSKREDDPRIPRLLGYIEPYYLRIRKSDLSLPPVDDKPLDLVDMDPLQRDIYCDLEHLYLEGMLNDNFDTEGARSNALSKIVRLMQATGNPSSLLYASDNPDTDFELPEELAEKIRTYGRTKTPAKFLAARDIIKSHLARYEKIIVWVTFVSTLKSLSSYLNRCGIKTKELYGETPTGSDADLEDTGDERTRESIIREFNDPDSGLNVVIANPAAVAESISLHHACHAALYLERSFNAAQYLQSRDRIHRYGLAKDVTTVYHRLACRDTIDEVVDQRLEMKEARMMRILESSDIPLFDNAKDGLGAEDIKALMRDYVRRTNRI